MLHHPTPKKRAAPAPRWNGASKMLLRGNKIIHCLKCNREKGIKLDRRRLFGLCLWIWVLASVAFFCCCLVLLCLYCGCIFTWQCFFYFLFQIHSLSWLESCWCRCFYPPLWRLVFIFPMTRYDRCFRKRQRLQVQCMEMTTILMHKMHINWIAYGFLMMHYSVVIFIVLLLLRLPSIWI